MADHITASALDKNATIASVTLAHGQPVPLAFERLSLPKVRLHKTIARRSVHIPLSTTSLPEGLDNIESPVATLVSTNNCHVSPISTHVNNLVIKGKCESSGHSPECRVPGRTAGEGGCLQGNLNHSSHTPEGSVNETSSVLTSITSSGRVESNAIVLGEDMAGCVVVDLQCNMVVQEHPTVQAPPEPYLVDEQLLVQVTQEQEPGHTQTSEPTNNSIIYDGGAAYVKEPKDKSIFDVAKKNSSRRLEEKKCESKVNGKCSDGVKTQSNFESRWNFREVLVKSECPLITEASQDAITQKDESETEDFARPRRKSAKKARLRWKNIHDVDNIGKISIKRPRHSHFLPREKHVNKIENPLEPLVNDEVVEDLPVWAERLTSVQVLDNKWVVGVASSSAILHQTLEGHSRCVLCDYIKSHPSSLQQRHLTRSQASRIMWHHQRIKFDGVPFTILSSDDLKCAFGMNYKIKRKGTERTTVENKQQAEEDFEQEERTDEDKDDLETRKLNKNKVKEGEMRDNMPKKRYKDVTFTSCTARITVKVIVKYPGYAVPYNAMPTERKVMLKALRRDMSQGSVLEKEELYHVTLPLSSVHNHPLQGRSRGIHPSVTSKIKELVSKGITAPKVIKRILDTHVKEQHDGDMVVPQLDDRAYYPRLKDIANLVYTQCKKMGISAKRKVSNDQTSFETNQRRKRKHRRTRSDGENEIVCSDNVMSDSVPLQASTLQEAVQTFCTDEPDRGSLSGLEGRECISADVVPRDGSGEVASLAEMVRGQLDTIRSLTYSLHEVGGLQEMYQSLQVILNQYMTNQHHTLQEGITEAPAATAFIIQDSMVDSLPSSASPAQGVSESTAEHLVISERDGNGSVITSKPRTTQNIGSQHVRQLRPPVALQCLTTSMVPSLAMSQLPRSTSQNPHQAHTHIVTSVPHSGNTPATATIPTPTYQTLGPATQDGSPAPVHLSLPPYFYYVQEVTVPESSQNWTYTTSS
ncbi:uncharacterized protein LOC121861076 [Homarus americanus]|uniref:uncharacterized protein LOC121861076 n=1 Tax=Homarus americanus TaxID=6706 RepID=UPI001C44DFD6|nr:uncharacterized protein LOC121861076 [Homarus americanus]